MHFKEFYILENDRIDNEIASMESSIHNMGGKDKAPKHMVDHLKRLKDIKNKTVK
jgi:hypothetical protein